MARLQLARRGLLVSGCVTALFGMSFAYGQDSSGQDDAETRAIQQLREAGGIVQNIAANTNAKEAKFHLSGTDITDEQLAPLPEVKELVWLNLRGTKITDKALVYVGKCQSLTNLQIPLTQITDAGLGHLSGLAELEILNLYGTQVSDAGLKHLEPLKKLRKLYVWQTQVTPEGAAQLREALPELEVVLGVDLNAKADDSDAAAKEQAAKEQEDKSDEDKSDAKQDAKKDDGNSSTP